MYFSEFKEVKRPKVWIENLFNSSSAPLNSSASLLTDGTTDTCISLPDNTSTEISFDMAETDLTNKSVLVIGSNWTCPEPWIIAYLQEYASDMGTCCTMSQCSLKLGPIHSYTNTAMVGCLYSCQCYTKCTTLYVRWSPYSWDYEYNTVQVCELALINN